MPWGIYNRNATEPVDPRELEEGDVLLAWGPEPSTLGRTTLVRYCHWATPAAADRLLAGLALEPVASFRADGRAGDLNLYLLSRRGEPDQRPAEAGPAGRRPRRARS